MTFEEQSRERREQWAYTLRLLLSFLVGATIAWSLWSYTGHCAERVAVIGDSQAYLLLAKDALPTLAARDGVELLGRPVPGSSAMSWALRHHDQQLRDVAAWRPGVVVVVLGTNDAYQGVRFVESEGPRIRGLVGRLSKMAPRVLWLGPPRLERRRQGCNAFYAILALEEVPTLDSREAPITFWGDRLHPDEPGRRAWAAWAWPRILGNASNAAPK